MSTQAAAPCHTPNAHRHALPQPAVAIAPIRGRRRWLSRLPTTARRRSDRPCATPPRCPRSGRPRASGSPRSTCGESAGGRACCSASSLVNAHLLLDDSIPARKPAGPADRQHGGGHRGRAPAAPPRRSERRDGPRRAARPHARRSRRRDRDQRDGRARFRWSPAGWSTRRTPPTFWRTWWLGDTSGGLVVLPLMLAWAQHPVAAWRRDPTWEGAAVIAGVVALSFARVLDRRADQVRGLPGADLGGVPIRPSGRDARPSRSPPAWRSASRPTTSGSSPSSPSTTAR